MTSVWSYKQIKMKIANLEEYRDPFGRTLSAQL